MLINEIIASLTSLNASSNVIQSSQDSLKNSSFEKNPHLFSNEYDGEKRLMNYRALTKEKIKTAIFLGESNFISMGPILYK